MMKRRIAMNLFSMLPVYLCCIVLTSGNNDKVSAFQITRTTARGIKLYQLVRSNDKFPSEIRPKRFTNDRFNQQNGSLNKNFDVIMKSSLFGHDSAVPHRGNADFDNQETIFSKLMHFRHRFLVKFMQNIKSLHRKIQKTMIAAIFVVTMFSSTLAMATSGGRIGGGGSFKSRSPSMSRPSSGSRTMAPPSRRI